MISKIDKSQEIKSSKIKFIYSGTLKKKYLSYELLKIFNELSKSYSFEFVLLYGKIKLDNSIYDKNLKNLLDEIRSNKNFIIKN